jgi:pimeloyl-ACP methyl ester carboxylesterase
LPASLRDGRGRTAVIFIHGFKTTYVRFMGAVDHVRHRVAGSSDEPESENRVVVVGFLWPCHLRPLAYGQSRSKAEAAATRLLHTVDLLASVGFGVVLVGHSMGCRVALRAATLAGQRPAASSPVIKSLILLGAAVPSDSIGPLASKING